MLQDLRLAIQKLCQSANPLGKCMELISDDVEMMNRELAKWRSEYSRSCEELESLRK